MDLQTAIDKLLEELVSAEKKFPAWPIDSVHAAAIVSEESGELVQAALNYSYSFWPRDRMEQEAIQTGAMAIRFLLNLNRLKRRKGYKEDIDA